MWKREEYENDGFHHYDGPGAKEQVGMFSSKEEANKAVKHTFYRNNPWGISESEMREKEEHDDFEEEIDSDGLLRLEISPPDSVVWTVCAQTMERYKKQCEEEREEEDEDDEDDDESDESDESDEESGY